MRIIFVTPFYYPETRFGGPPQKIHSLAKELVALGHKVLVATFNSEARTARNRACTDGVSVQYLPWIGRGLRQIPISPRLLSGAIAASEVVHCYGLYNLICPAAVMFAARCKRPFVVEPLGMYPPRARNRPAKRLYNLLATKWMVRRASAVIAASPAEANELKQVTEPKKIVFRRNGIDIARFTNLPGGEKLRERWSISADEKIVLFIGRLSPIKNLEQLIIAFEKANIWQSRLVLVGPVGEAAYVARLRGLIAARALERCVLLAGPLYEEEQRAALAIADLFVLPSLSESFGNAAGEAVAAGIPVILTNTCGIAPIIDKRAGLSVALGIDALAESLKKMLLDAPFRNAVTSRRDEVTRELSWDQPVKQTEELYKRILAGTKA